MDPFEIVPQGTYFQMKVGIAFGGFDWVHFFSIFFCPFVVTNSCFRKMNVSKITEMIIHRNH